MSVTVILTGDRALAAKLTPERIAGPPARRLLTRSAIAVQGNARGFARVDRGQWRNSIVTAVDATPFPTWAKVGSNLSYAPFVHNGRRAGRMPPDAPIRGWARRHGIPEEAVFPIRRAIGRRGTTGDKALTRGLNASKPAIQGFVAICAREIEAGAGSGR
jgi:hypothetical protein